MSVSLVARPRNEAETLNHRLGHKLPQDGEPEMISTSRRELMRVAWKSNLGLGTVLILSILNVAR